MALHARRDAAIHFCVCGSSMPPNPEPLRECHHRSPFDVRPLARFRRFGTDDHPVQVRGCGVREQETIIHNTGDEPILVEQADGSQLIVRPGEKRQARLLSRGDFANAATPIRSANPTRPR